MLAQSGRRPSVGEQLMVRGRQRAEEELLPGCQRTDRSGMAIAVAPRIRPPAILPPCRMPGFSLIWTPTLSAIAPTVELISNPAW